MLDANTITRMHELNLKEMAREFDRQLSDPGCNNLSFEERMALLVDLEWNKRYNGRVARAVKKARFAMSGACVENIAYHDDRKLDKGQISRLASCAYVSEGRNIAILGASGAGKTYLACALGNAACRNTLSTAYIRLPELLNELAVARAESTFRETLGRYKKARLLILDEWLLYPLKVGEARDLLEIIESRTCAKASMIFCSQFDTGEWHKRIGSDTVADAVCDRIVYNSHRILIEGKDSMRKRTGFPADEA
jgi:DNA replication protein DnaC